MGTGSGIGGGSWSIPEAGDASSYKTYTVDATSIPSKKFGNLAKGTLTVASGSGSERFKVMTITDESGKYTWDNACAKRAGLTGKWVLPSREEWTIFGSSLGITSNNRVGYGLQNLYWSTTTVAGYDNKAWTFAPYGNISMCHLEKNAEEYVKLTATY